jgi:predicted transcriptional regulator
MSKVDINAVIESWRWRIVRAGHNAKGFACLMDTSPALISDYLNKRRKPTLKRFEQIENKLRELEESAGHK